MDTKRIVIALFLAVALAQGAYAHPRNDQLWAKLQVAASIPEGVGTRHLYVFFDPNCPYCHDLYDSLQPLIGPKGLKVDWIPVGILALTSFGKAAALLESPNPSHALAQAEHRFRRGRGGEVRPQRATPMVAQKLQSNEQLLNAAGGNGVPLLVYKDQTGHVHTVVGDPPLKALVQIIARIKTRVRPTQERGAP
ncbi:MAG: thioredoxin fold domain-containing protein [Acidiferrobacter sp.]